MSPQEIAGILRKLHSAYGTEVTEDVATLWANTFGGDDDELVRDATYEWIRERNFFPTPADLRTTMRAIMRRADPERELEAATGRPITGAGGGWQIAYDAYCAVVRREDREPKPFDEFVGRIPDGEES